MAFTIYDAFIVPCRLRLDATAEIIGKARGEGGVSERELLDARLTDDMYPLPFQIKRMVVHSRGALQSAMSGVFSPDSNSPPQSIPELITVLRDTSTWLSTLLREDVDVLVDKRVLFKGSRTTMEFTGASFLTFALPNVDFHATVAYTLVRRIGVDIGKRDYLGTATFQRR